MLKEQRKEEATKKELDITATADVEVKIKGKFSISAMKSKRKNNKRKIDEFIRRGSTKDSAPLLIVKDIKKNFGDFEALKGISFKIARGERIGLIGGNGAGKTTVSEIIAGINKPSSGTLTFGFDFEDSPKEGIGMQFQQSEYPSGLTVKDIIQFAIRLRKLTIEPEELQDLLQVFQMSDFYTRKVRSLSGGQRQKLNILLSIIHNPDLVILDELSTGLDISAREEIIEFTDNLLTKRKMSAILISHHMAEIRALCSRVIILDNGAVRDVKTIVEVEKKYGSLEEYSKKLIAQSNLKLIQMEKDKKLHKEDHKFSKKHIKAKKEKESKIDSDTSGKDAEIKDNDQLSKKEAKALNKQNKKDAKASKKESKKEDKALNKEFKKEDKASRKEEKKEGK